MDLRRLRWTILVRVLVDAVLINLAFFLAYWVRYRLQWFRPVDEAFYVPYAVYFPASLALTLILLVIYWAEGFYDEKHHYSLFNQAYMVFRGTVTSIAALYVLSLLYRQVLYSRLIFAYAGILILVMLTIARAVENQIIASLRIRGIGVQQVLIVGAGETGRTIMRNIVAQPDLGYQVVGFLDDKPERGGRDFGRFKGLGGTDQIPQVIARYRVDLVIITLPWLYHRKILGIMAQCERSKVAVKIVPDLFQLSLSDVDIDDLNGVPLIGIKTVSIMGWNLALKRLMDIVVAVVALILVSPVMLIVAILVKLDSPGPVIFRQTRIGRGGRPFTVLKFRSMRESAEQEKPTLTDLNEASGPLFKIKEDPRITRLGGFLRRASLDELPQFFNVLKGDMSVVGPRPHLPEEVEQYQEWHKKRLRTWPGLTGLWQVSGRSDLTFDEMMLLDIYYVENWSLLMDLRIALKTIPVLILGTGAY